MRQMIAMIKANLKMTTRNRNALFWNLAFPALFILLFGALLNDNGDSSIDVGIVGDGSQYQQTVESIMRGSKSFDVTDGDEEHELDKLKDGDRDVVIVFGDPGANGIPAVTLYYDNSNASTATIQVAAVSQILYGAANESNPVQIQETSITGDDISYIDFLVPGIVAMSLMNSGIIGLSTAFVAYREQGILRRIRLTPFPLQNFILARIISQVIVAFLQSAILIGLGAAVYGVSVEGNVFQLGLAIFVSALCFLGVGFAMSSFARNTEEAASYSNLITFPMLFLSGIFFDVDDAPSWLKPITRIMPLRYAADAIRDTMTNGKGLSAIWVDLVVLLAIFVVALVIAVRFFRWDSRAV
jgi:ABC-2 type transport system permease protein